MHKLGFDKVRVSIRKGPYMEPKRVLQMVLLRTQPNKPFSFWIEEKVLTVYPYPVLLFGVPGLFLSSQGYLYGHVEGHLSFTLYSSYNFTMRR